MGFKIEYRANVQFRIIAPNGEKGQWARYESIATIEIDGKTWVAVTDYYAPKLIANRVMPIGETTIPTKVIAAETTA